MHAQLPSTLKVLHFPTNGELTSDSEDGTITNEERLDPFVLELVDSLRKKCPDIEEIKISKMFWSK